MRSIAIKETVRRPQLPPVSPSFWLPCWLHLKALFWLYLMSPFWLLFNSNAGSRSVSILARLQASQRLFFVGGGGGDEGGGGGFIVARFLHHLTPPPHHPPHPLFSFSTPGSWPPARSADQWEIQAQAFCLGWHFAFVFPTRL